MAGATAFAGAQKFAHWLSNRKKKKMSSIPETGMDSGPGSTINWPGDVWVPRSNYGYVRVKSKRARRAPRGKMTRRIMRISRKINPFASSMLYTKWSQNYESVAEIGCDMGALMVPNLKNIPASPTTDQLTWHPVMITELSKLLVGTFYGQALSGSSLDDLGWFNLVSKNSSGTFGWDPRVWRASNREDDSTSVSAFTLGKERARLWHDVPSSQPVSTIAGKIGDQIRHYHDEFSMKIQMIGTKKYDTMFRIDLVSFVEDFAIPSTADYKNGVTTYMSGDENIVKFGAWANALSVGYVANPIFAKKGPVVTRIIKSWKFHLPEASGDQQMVPSVTTTIRVPFKKVCSSYIRAPSSNTTDQTESIANTTAGTETVADTASPSIIDEYGRINNRSRVFLMIRATNPQRLEVNQSYTPSGAENPPSFNIMATNRFTCALVNPY